MAAEWVEVRYEGGLTRVAMVNGYSITVFGSQGLWSWFIDLDGCNVADGVERNLADAVIAAEDEAHRLAGNSGTA
jgi:hypothetical protein